MEIPNPRPCFLLIIYVVSTANAFAVHIGIVDGIPQISNSNCGPKATVQTVSSGSAQPAPVLARNETCPSQSDLLGKTGKFIKQDQEILASFASRNSPSSQSLSISLSDLISISANYTPSTNPLTEITDLTNLLLKPEKISQDRKDRVDHQLQVLGKYQFADHLAIRELVANGLDSYYYDSKMAKSIPTQDKKVEVRIKPSNSSVSIEDHGKGMGIQEIIYYLLTPGRSSNNQIIDRSATVDGVTGRFGQGFFSVLSFLKDPNDKITIYSQKHNGYPVQVTIFKDSHGKYQVEIAPGAPRDQGTTISIHSSRLNDQHQGRHLHEVLGPDVVQKYFKYSNRGLVSVNQLGSHFKPPLEVNRQAINQGQQNSVFHSVGDRTARIQTHQHLKEEGEGRLAVTVNGVLIQDFSFKGLNIFGTTVLDLPSETTLTQDRGTLDFKDEQTKNLVRSLAQSAIHKGDFALLNSIYPLLGNEGFDLIHELKFEFPQQAALPTDPSILDVQSIGVPSHAKPAEFLNPLLFKAGNLIRQLPSHYPSLDNPVVPFSSERTDHLVRFVPSGNQNLVLLNQSVPANGPLTYPLINIIHKEQVGRFGGSSQIIPQHVLNPKSALTESQFNHAPAKESAKEPDAVRVKADRIKHLKEAILGDEPSEYCKTLKHCKFMEGILFDIWANQPKVNWLMEWYLNERSNPDYQMQSALKEFFKSTDLIPILIELYGQDYPALKDLESEDSHSPLTPAQSQQLVEDLTKDPKVQELLSLREKAPDGPVTRSYARGDKFGDKWASQVKTFLSHQRPTIDQYIQAARELNEMVEKFYGFHSSEASKEVLEQILASGKGKRYLSLFLKAITRSQEMGLDTYWLTDILFRKLKAVEFPKANSFFPEKWVIERSSVFSYLDPMDHWDYTHQPEKIDRYLEYLYRVRASDGLSDRDHWQESPFNSYNPLWNEYLDRHLLNSNGFNNLAPDELKFLCDFSLKVCSFGIAQFSSESTKTELKQNCFHVLNDLSSRLRASTLAKANLKSLELSLQKFGDSPEFKAFRIHSSKPAWGEHSQTPPKHVAHPDLDELYQLMVERGLVDQNSIEYLYPMIYGDSVKFRAENPIALPTAGNWQPLETHSKLIDIMGRDSTNNHKEILKAMAQHPDPHAWIKETLKNSIEAGASQYDMSVFKDEHEQLVVKLTDDGKGMSPDQMKYLLVPGYSSKTKDSADINFGWGFFTLFKTFDEVAFQTSKDGNVRTTVHLRKRKDGGLDISEQVDTRIENHDPFPIGTQLYLKQARKATPTDPVKLKAQLIKTQFTLRGGSITFNGDAAKPPHSLVKDEPPVLTKPIRVGGEASAQVEILQRPVVGIYYNDRFHSDQIKKYETTIPASMKELTDELSIPLSIQLTGKLAQNLNRTAFIDDDQIHDQVKQALEEGTFHAVARELRTHPKSFLDKQMLGYDFFYEFRHNDDSISKHLQNKINARNHEQSLFSVVNTKTDIGRYISGLPMSENGPSLIQLKSKIKAFLFENKIIDSRGNYLRGSYLRHADLVSAFPEPELQPLLQVFEWGIRTNIPPKLDEKRDVEIKRDLTISEIVKAVEESVKSSSSSESREQQQAKIAYLKAREPMFVAMAEFVKAQVRQFLGREIQVEFFSNPGTHILAHATPGTNKIAFNIAESLPDHFEEMWKAKKFNRDTYVKLINTVTHEMTHLDEGTEETGTHNHAFFERQQKLLEKWFMFNDENVAIIEHALANLH